MSEVKQREVIPDLMEQIQKCLQVTDSLRARHAAIYQSLHGEMPGKEEEKKSLEGGSIMILEAKIRQLVEELTEIDKSFGDVILTIFGGR